MWDSRIRNSSGRKYLLLGRAACWLRKRPPSSRASWFSYFSAERRHTRKRHRMCHSTASESLVFPRRSLILLFHPGGVRHSLSNMVESTWKHWVTLNSFLSWKVYWRAKNFTTSRKPVSRHDLRSSKDAFPTFSSRGMSGEASGQQVPPCSSTSSKWALSMGA